MWRGGGGVLLLVGTAMVSGCAGGQARQQLTRLQTQVGMLDERITQLERSSAAPVAAAPLGEPAAAADRTTVEVTPNLAPRATASKAPAAKASLRPSTREIQQALKNAGFYQGAVDGKMGSMTREAVREFQQVHGLSPDGKVGRQTWAKLSAYADLSAGGGEATAAEALK